MILHTIVVHDTGVVVAGGGCICPVRTCLFRLDKALASDILYKITFSNMYKFITLFLSCFSKFQLHCTVYITWDFIKTNKTSKLIL